MDTNAGTLPNE
jgi:hypothetical protein